MSVESLDDVVPSKDDLLTMAIVEKNPAAVKFLLKHGADANARYLGEFSVDKKHSKNKLHAVADDLRTNLHDALHHYGSRSSCHSFCRKPVVPLIPTTLDKIDMFRSVKIEWVTEDESPTAMHIAAANGKVDILESLILYGGDVNARMEGGYTPLILAVLRKKYKAAVLLIEHGANLNAQSKWGKSALYYAAKTKQLKMVQLLVSAGVEVNVKTHNDVTPLHIACERKLQEIAQVLIKNGSDVNARTSTGLTPLYCAAVSGLNEIVELILKNGGDVCSIMDQGKINVTPLLSVSEEKKRKISELLYKHAPIKPRKTPGLTSKLIEKLLKHLPRTISRPLSPFIERSETDDSNRT